ncbi:MAG: hypothetical protein GY810_15505 [Aureispira sp.]|nr:hypothetical protein [Aureispira sp.]
MTSKFIFIIFLLGNLIGNCKLANSQSATNVHIAKYINQLASEKPLFEEYEGEYEGEYEYEYDQETHFGDNIYLTSTAAVISEDISGTSFLGESFDYFILIATKPYPTILTGNYYSGEARMNLEEYYSDKEDKTSEDFFIEKVSYKNNPNQISYPFQFVDECEFSMNIFQLKNKKWESLTSENYWTQELEKEILTYFPLYKIKVHEKSVVFTINMPSLSSLSTHFQYYKSIFGDLSQHKHKFKLTYDNQQLTLQHSPKNYLGLGWKNNKLTLLTTPKQKPLSTKTKNHCFDSNNISKVTFTGFIGENSVSMKLIIDPKNLSKITGEYWYGNSKKTMPLVGSCHNTPFGKITLTRKKNDKIREYFHGNFDLKGNIKGNWGHINQENVLSFKLNQQ